MSAPSVYAAINAITAELACHGIAKTRTNQVDDYKYRSIDDVLDRLAPLLAKHRLCVFPRALERAVTERSDEQGRLLIHVALRVSFTLTSVDDGSSHEVEAFGEALDGGDKATAKAMSAAYKAAMVQTFCIPVCAGRGCRPHQPPPHCKNPQPGAAQRLDPMVPRHRGYHRLMRERGCDHAGPGAQPRSPQGAQPRAAAPVQ